MAKQETLPSVVSEKFSANEISLLRETYAKGLNDTQLKVFLKQCEAMDLNPFTKEIYGMALGGKLVLITSIGGLRKIAHKTGAYLGCKVEVERDEKGRAKAATATVKKLVQGHVAEFSYTALAAEYSTGQNNWKTMETVMLSKCAEAGAIRMGFSSAEGLYEESEIGAIQKSPRKSERTEELTSRFMQGEAKVAPAYPDSESSPIEIELEPEGEPNGQ